ncbi:hypothetical protein K491DRAFT_690216 [Lophiostoma macrostomum CBS 122681]|uniref:DUF7730 domain-containing protein n=1 Tax=Lophiostoma macrostomum CBS 122681 TaxID=1314788 RepID=A0A6A6TH51_9PLEO|nr:hypothetical protein K491DRAFT_690216 [Lophiostoma macrostomum CBS 122681]
MSMFPAAQGRPARRVRGFLGLPGELRNRIYEDYFQANFCVELMAKGTTLIKTQPSTVKISLNLCHGPARAQQKPTQEEAQIILRVSRTLGRHNRVEGIRTRWPTSLSALVLVCKLVHRETIVLLYRKSTFVFDAPRRIQSFITTVPIINLAHITRLQLHYTTYCNPQYTKDRIWQEKHLKSWTAACKRASKYLVSVEALEVWLWSPYDVWFDLREPYVQPLLRFRRLACGDHCTLTSVKVHFNEGWVGFGRRFGPSGDLARAAKELHGLWGEAISKAILGQSEKESMAELKASWERHSLFHHHLSYMPTGW